MIRDERCKFETSSSDGGTDEDRRQRVAALMAEVATRSAAGGAVDEAALVREHPELMPELGDGLRDLRLLRQAFERAQHVETADSSGDARDQLLDEELRLLHAALEDYEVLERVRYGGQGVVYKARQHGTNRIVALKLLLDGPLASEHKRGRFEREIELVSRLRHPNIVTVYESGVVRGRNFYAMEFIDGMRVDDYVVWQDLAPDAIVQLMIKVCRAVHHAHQHGVIHRDLNPANILADEDGEPRVFDFGLAQDLWASADDARMTPGGAGCGTLPYLSPEQAGVGGEVDVLSDVYALGLVLYRLLTDTFPYPAGGGLPALREAILNSEPLPLRGAIALGDPQRAPGAATINRDLEAVLDKALAKAKADRYQTAADLADDLEQWLAGDAVRARSGSRLYALRKGLRRHRVAAAVAASIAAIFTLSSIAVTHYWLQARAQRDNARRATAESFGVFDLALTEVEDSVRPLAGGVAVRDRLIKRLSDKLPALETLVESDATLTPIRTRLLEKQGDIAFQQGQRAEAVRFYQAFLDASRHQAEQEPGSGSAAADVVRGYRKLGEACEAPAPFYEPGIVFGEAAVARAPSDEDARYELCGLRLSYGDYLRNGEHLHEALSQFERTRELSPLAGSAGAPISRWSRILADATSGQGLVLRKLGQGAEGRKHSEFALELRRQMVAQNPADTESRLALLWSCTHLGTLCKEAGNSQEAQEYLRMAAEQSDLLGTMDPGAVAWDQDRYSVHHQLASLSLDMNDLAEAHRQTDKATGIAERWAARESGDQARTTLFFSFMLQGKLQKTEATWSAACAAYQEARSVGQQLLEARPDEPVRITQLASAYDGLAACSRELGDLARALAYRQRVYELQQRLLTLQPSAVDAVLKVIAAQVRLASAYIGLRSAPERARAEELLAEAERTLTDLGASGKLIDWEGQRNFLLRLIEDTRKELQAQNAESPGASLDHRDSGASE